MRIYLSLRKNDKSIPFNYQELLTGVIHKWIGKDNGVHGKSGHYSFSWIQNTIASKKGINLKDGAYFFIGTYKESLLKQIIKGILEDPEMFHGVKVNDVQIKNIPDFSSSEKFLMASPVLLKIKQEDKISHVTLEDNNFEEVLTESFKNRLEKANLLSEGISIRLNPETNFRQTKLVTYKGIKNRTSLAPIIIEGTPEQIAFAWCTGLGNSTGIGFGALK
ncbi:CRISPR-associated endoribonuclease Cas6 [Gelidibacter sp. F63206]|uniref:CRISPR-associated endoribonuclease Cas6 n=1 Tax=Gelidibacter sp. F63206 TaxID=2926425 RepID=UPI001FF6AA93|nr:CRISPR-associated endoribonuclease Cas6 [Gelidibacter sp. F63206]MCK0115324.1 CRISPR-associated endoribonuclease Cas6 [Gelidibacter sp. F63206]